MVSNQDVFISHSSLDSKLAYAMCDYLEEKKISCWIAPRDVQGGTEYAEAIIMGIRNCKIMVVLFNKNANDSIYVKNEVERAFNYKSILIPFKLDQTIPSASLELFLGSVHSLDATTGNPEDCFDLLYQNCERVLKKKERIFKEKPIIPSAFESEESTIENLHEHNQEEKNPQNKKINESKINKRIALIGFGSLLFFIWIFIFYLNSEPPPPVVKPIITWVDIPKGEFKMGNPEYPKGTDEIPHKVSLNAFKMSAHEITFEQYDVFCEATEREMPSDQGWGRGKRPVTNVSWLDATAFAKWMDCRLPTEAEWEYACRSGSTTPFNTGKVLSTSVANFDTNIQTKEVGSFDPNKWGLHDMHGNVWEWCSDWYGAYKPKNQLNPTGPSKGAKKINRGGCYESTENSCRSYYRHEVLDSRYQNVGFRLVSLSNN